MVIRFALLSFFGLFFSAHADVKIVKEAYETVRKITNEAEPPGVDHWKLPSETLRDGKGDCEDKAFLLQQMLLEKGVKTGSVVFGWYQLNEEEGYNHVWLEIKLDDKLYVVDPANDVFQQAKEVADTFTYRDLDMIQERIFKRMLSDYRKRLTTARQSHVAERIVCALD